MGSQTVTGSVKLVPSGYVGLTGMTINSSYPIGNSYYDSSHTSYTRFDVTQSTTGYIYYTFDTSEIPDNATITSVTGKFKARVSSTSRVTNTVAQLYANTTAKGSNVTFASTSASVRNLSPGTSWTRSEISNLRLRIGGTASSSSSSKRIDFYGADVTVNYSYTITTYDVTSSLSGSGTIEPSGTTEIVGGDEYVLIISGHDPTVLDNNVDVTSQLVQGASATDTLIPEDYTASSFTVSNIGNAYHDATNTTYATCQVAGSTTATIYLDLSDVNIPSAAEIKSVTCQVTTQFNANGSSSGFTSSMQMYAGSTAKGSSYQWVSSGSNVAKNTYTLTVGNWTAEEINNARFYLTATNSARSTQRQVYIYGVSFNVTYEVEGEVYTYTISNVSANHTIVVTISTSTTQLYVKLNGTWTTVTAAYKKVNGSWVQQSDLSTVFSSNINYRKMN